MHEQCPGNAQASSTGDAQALPKQCGREERGFLTVFKGSDAGFWAADRWPVVVAALLGQPLPPLPDLPGRVYRKPWGGRDRLAEQWDALEQRTTGYAPGWKAMRP